MRTSTQPDCVAARALPRQNGARQRTCRDFHIDPPDRLTLRHLTVYDLTLRPGPSLVFGFPEARQNKTTRATADVTTDASRFLFHAIRIEPGVTLNDILLLLDACPALVDGFRLRFADQVRDEVRKGPLAQSLDSGRTSQALEHLELRWAWGLDTDTLEYSSVHALELSGVGPVVQADDARSGLRAGDRDRWSLKLTPVRELLHLPVVVRHDFVITETDHNSRKYGEPVANGRLTEVTLGQLIHGLLSELTFHGGPTEQAALSEELVQQLSRRESGDEDKVDAESVLNELMPEDAGFSAMFETLGDVTQSDVRRVMYSIEDDQAASPEFDAAFGGCVRVREQHRQLTGRQFRKALREAMRDVGKQDVRT